MATSIIPSRPLFLLVSTAICLFASTTRFGKAYDGSHNLGAAKVIADEYVPGAEAQGEDGEVGPIITKALECFNDRYIYSSCDEEYRLTQNGDLNVPREYADEYCDGACAKETELVLECVEQIFKHFRFYNRATCRDVRETIKVGCGYGHRRGDFNVAEHVRVDEVNAGTKISIASLVYAMIIAWNLLF